MEKSFHFRQLRSRGGGGGGGEGGVPFGRGGGVSIIIDDLYSICICISTYIFV